MTAMQLYENASIVTCAGPSATDTSEQALLRELAIIRDGYLVASHGKIIAIGEGKIPTEYRHGQHVVKCAGRLMTPMFVDCHTHMIFAGDRVRDFRDKMAGVAYQTIAARGGGIQSTVRATASASDDELLRSTFRRMRASENFGVGTIEVKTGYGGEVATELRLLKVLLELVPQVRNQAGTSYSVELVPTWLGLHGPPIGDRSDYLRAHHDVLAQVHAMFLQAGVAPMLDVYLDDGAYSLVECDGYLRYAKSHGFQLRGHVGQFRDLGGVELLAELGARSCDHLEQVSDSGLVAMSRAGTSAVLLPGAWRTLRQQAPNAERMQSTGVRVAVATDCNPGTSPTQDLQLCAALAVRDAGLHPDAALLAITRRAAEVLDSRNGVLRVNSDARFAIWDTDEVAAFGYYLGGLSRWVE